MPRNWEKEWGDAVYEAWRRGGDPDALDYDEALDRFHDGWTGEEIGAAEARQQCKPKVCPQCFGTGYNVSCDGHEDEPCPRCQVP